MQQAGQHLGAHALHRADAQPAPLTGRDRGDIGRCAAQAGQHGAGVLGEHGAGLGGLDGARTAGPVEQGGAGDALERGDLLADR